MVGGLHHMRTSALQECCLLPSSSQYLSSLSYTSYDHQSRTDTTHTGLDPPTLIINQENVPQACLQANLIEALPQLGFPLSK